MGRATSDYKVRSALINLPCVALSLFSLDGEAHPVSSRLGSPVPVAMFLMRGLKGFRDG